MARELRLLLLGIPLVFALAGAGPPGTEAPEEGQSPAPHPDAVARTQTSSSYESLRAGHPLRIVAYALHPVGVILDYAIFRPAYWIGTHEPIRTLVGQTD